MPLLRIAVLACALVAVAAGPAAARTVRATDVKLKGADIGCFLTMGETKEIECFGPAIDTGELDGYVALRPTGKARRGERGDYPGFGNRPVVLRKGDLWLREGITCVAGKAAISCSNRDDRGFRLDGKGARLR